jgi:hypothetical protein
LFYRLAYILLSTDHLSCQPLEKLEESKDVCFFWVTLSNRRTNLPTPDKSHYRTSGF